MDGVALAEMDCEGVWESTAEPLGDTLAVCMRRPRELESRHSSQKKGNPRYTHLKLRC